MEDGTTIKDCRTAHSPHRLPRFVDAQGRHCRRGPVWQLARSELKAAGLQQRVVEQQERIAALEVELATLRSCALVPATADAPLPESVSVQIMALQRKNLDEVRKLTAAVQEELRDPADPDRYTLLPYARSSDVLYTVAVPGPRGGVRFERRRENLQKLLDRAGVTGIDVSDVEVKHRGPDPAELLLKCCSSNESSARLLLDTATAAGSEQAIMRLSDAVVAAVWGVDDELGRRVGQAIVRVFAGYAATSDLAQGFAAAIEGTIEPEVPAEGV